MRKGRFQGEMADVARRFSESVSYDHRLYRHDITGSIAHAHVLATAGILSSKECSEIERALNEIEKEIGAGKFQWDPRLEDLHMNIEAALVARIGQTGAKLHTARSRNDQVAVDLRLYVKEQIEEIVGQTRDLQSAMLDLAAAHVDVIMPGYTHLQRAQPVYFAHYWLGQIETFQRDIERLRDCLERTDVMPLGSGAIAGSTIVLDRTALARDLGFSKVSQNSVDAVSDRDFVCEFLFDLALIGTHLSRLSEDCIIWSSAEFGFIEFGDEFATGSSLMPQKKNPDMAELTRGKTGRLYGNLMSILTVLKGLPSSYNRDLQEDKEAVFDSVDTVTAALELWAAMLPQLNIRRERMENAAADPALLATDLAEHLVKKGMPFREAHAAVGQLVAKAIEKNVSLDKLSKPQVKEILPAFDGELSTLFDARTSLGKRTAIGAPAPKNIEEQIKRWRSELSRK